MNLCVTCNVQCHCIYMSSWLNKSVSLHSDFISFSGFSFPVFLLNISYTWKWFRTVHDCRVPSEYVRKSVNKKKSRKYERCAQTRDVGVCAYSLCHCLSNCRWKSVASYSRFHICECQIKSLSGTIADESETKEKDDQPTRRNETKRINAKRNERI